MTDLTPDQLADALAEPTPADLDTAEPLAIADERHANRVLRRLALLDAEQSRLADDAEADLAALEAIVQPERDRIAEFLDDRLYGIKRAREYHLRGLEGWMRMVNAADPKTVTVKVASGHAALRKNPERLEVSQPEAVAARFPDAVKPAEVIKAEVKKLVKPSGHKVGPDAAGVVIPEGYHAESAVDADGGLVLGLVFLVADVKRFEWNAQ